MDSNFQYASTVRWHRATDLSLPPTVKRRSAGAPASHDETAFRGAAGFPEARRHAVHPSRNAVLRPRAGRPLSGRKARPVKTVAGAAAFIAGQTQPDGDHGVSTSTAAVRRFTAAARMAARRIEGGPAAANQARAISRHRLASLANRAARQGMRQ
jgi:hypothetical protein